MQFVELSVDENPQALKRPRRRMDVARLGTHHLADDIGKRARGRDRRLAPCRDDGARDLPRETFLSEDVDDVGEIGFRGGGDNIGGGGA